MSGKQTGKAMERIGKGIKIGRHLDDYCVVDLETTDKSVARAEIIEISAIRVRNNQSVDSFTTLVNPHCSIPAEATDVNHITDNMVLNAPDLTDVIDDFISFVGSDVVVGFNNASFDMNVIYDKYFTLRERTFSNNYIDVKHMAQKCLKNIRFRLEDVSKYYGLNTEGEHRGLKDCQLTKECYDCLFKEYGEAAFGSDRNKSGGYRVQYSSETKALQELQALLDRVIKDARGGANEFPEVENWKEAHRELSGKYPFNKFFTVLDQSFVNGKMRENAWEDAQAIFAELIDPVGIFENGAPIDSVYGKHICLTGDFDYGDRGVIETLIQNAGGLIDLNVKKNTDYVVVGARGSAGWKAGNYGGKIQRAMELKDKGTEIRIIKEAEFICAVTNIEKKEVALEKKESSQSAWTVRTQKMLDELVQKNELPKDSLYLSENNSAKDVSKIISYSICIWEPDYPVNADEKPNSTKTVVTIAVSDVKSRPDELTINMSEEQEENLHNYLPEGAEVVAQNKDDARSKIVRIRLRETSAGLIEYLMHCTDYCLKRYVSPKTGRFGCCHLFAQCSDAGKCIHINKLYSKACIYRVNLEQGRIFYGEKGIREEKAEGITQKVEVDNETVILDSKRNYTGKENPDDEEKLVRKAIGLPVSKHLIYYTDKHDPKSIVSVEEFRLVEMYDITERWYTVEIHIADGRKIRIHSMYLIEMQKPSFVSDMAEQGAL